MAAEQGELEFVVRVPLPPGVAGVALGSLGPDMELTPGAGGFRLRPQAQLQCCGDQLQARWVSGGPRGLRGRVTSFLELLGLVLETIETFGEGGQPHTTSTPPNQSPPHLKNNLDCQ